MDIIKATIEHSDEISRLMLSDLESPDSRFPQEMINNFKEHAKEENIKKEFENPNLIAFTAINHGKIMGFIVGYEDTPRNNAMIHYITAKESKTSKDLLNRFIKECKLRKIRKIITDTFEFMDNNELFRSNKFKLIKKEKIAPNLEMLWYELSLE